MFRDEITGIDYNLTMALKRSLLILCARIGYNP
jgi:hypothetical protein